MNKLFCLMGKWSLAQELGTAPLVNSSALLQFVLQWLLGKWRNRTVAVGDLMKKLYKTVLYQFQEWR